MVHSMSKVIQATQVRKDPLVHKALQVRRDRRDRKDLQEPLVLKAILDPRAQQGHRDPLDLLDPLVKLDHKAQQDHKATQDHRVLLDLQDRRATQDQ